MPFWPRRDARDPRAAAPALAPYPAADLLDQPRRRAADSVGPAAQPDRAAQAGSARRAQRPRRFRGLARFDRDTARRDRRPRSPARAARARAAAAGPRRGTGGAGWLRSRSWGVQLSSTGTCRSGARHRPATAQAPLRLLKLQPDVHRDASRAAVSPVHQRAVPAAPANARERRRRARRDRARRPTPSDRTRLPGARTVPPAMAAIDPRPHVRLENPPRSAQRSTSRRRSEPSPSPEGRHQLTTRHCCEDRLRPVSTPRYVYGGGAYAPPGPIGSENELAERCRIHGSSVGRCRRAFRTRAGRVAPAVRRAW